VTTSTASGNRRTAQRRLEEEQWEVLLRDQVPAYITWEQWRDNQRILRENSTKFGFGVSRGATLLAGRIVCGRCGAGMPVHYRQGIPTFACSLANQQFGQPHCQTFNARWLEPLIEELVLQALEPASIELSLAATEDIEADRARLETHHKQSVERARYEAELARRRYEEVDPGNRLVAAELEQRWEAALGAQRKCEEELNRFQQERPAKLTPQQRETITGLSSNFRALWRSASTSGKDRQDLVRILIERIVIEVLDGTERLSVTVQWAGGFTSQHETRRTVSTFDELDNAAELFARAQELYNSGCPRAELIQRLNDEGYRPARKGCFTQTSINALLLVLRRKGLIASQPALSKPWWRSSELSKELSIRPATLTGWRHRGWVQAKQFGRRWIYWANDVELRRLKKLAIHPPSGSSPTPEELRIPRANMPVENNLKS
jgi:hypothetical protein